MLLAPDAVSSGKRANVCGKMCASESMLTLYCSGHRVGKPFSQRWKRKNHTSDQRCPRGAFAAPVCSGDVQVWNASVCRGLIPHARRAPAVFSCPQPGPRSPSLPFSGALTVGWLASSRRASASVVWRGLVADNCWLARTPFHGGSCVSLELCACVRVRGLRCVNARAHVMCERVCFRSRLPGCVLVTVCVCLCVLKASGP